MSDEGLIQERLARIEEKLDRLARLELQVTKMADPMESLSDLGRDLSLLMGPGAKLLTEELAEVETGFQLEDIFYMFKRLLLSLRNISWGLEQLENLADWWHDVEPILKVAVPRLIDGLDRLDELGVFRMLGKMTSAEMLRFLDLLTEVPMAARLAEAPPAGPVSLLWKLRQPECRQGLGVVLELTRVLGKLKQEGVSPAPEKAPAAAGA